MLFLFPVIIYRVLHYLFMVNLWKQRQDRVNLSLWTSFGQMERYPVRIHKILSITQVVLSFGHLRLVIEFSNEVVYLSI